MAFASSCETLHDSAGALSSTLVSLAETTTSTATSGSGDSPPASPTNVVPPRRAERSASDLSSTEEAADAKAWIEDIQRLSDLGTVVDDDIDARTCCTTRRRGGIMVVRCARESCSKSATDALRQAARGRRSLRYQKHGHNNNSDPVRVSFSTVQIREHACILGDNPGGTIGPPLSIEWAPMSDVTVDLEKYEAARPPRRDHLEMQMPASYRKDLLRRSGYTRGEIVELTKPVNIARAQRARTRETLKLDPVNELVEKLGRKTLNVLTFGMRKRHERNFLKPYVVMSKLCLKEEASRLRATSPSRSVSTCETSSMDFTAVSDAPQPASPTSKEVASIAAAESPVAPDDGDLAAPDNEALTPLERDVSPGRDRSLMLSI